MSTTLKTTFGTLALHMPDLLRLRNGTLLPTSAPPALARLGLADDAGLTRKGQKVLANLLSIADTLDVPYA